MGSDRQSVSATARLFQGRTAAVGLTKRDKGTKLMLLTDGKGTPFSAFTVAANVPEVHTIETRVYERLTDDMPPRLLYDKAAGADWLRDSLEQRDVKLITPHRKNRKRPPRHDGRLLRRYKRHQLSVHPQTPAP